MYTEEKDVSLSVSFNLDHLLSKEEEKVLAEKAFASGINSIVFDIGGPTSSFLTFLGEISKSGISQNVISLFKYARDIGAKWVIFSLERKV